MPLYDYKCKVCSDIRSINVSIRQDREIECCGVTMQRVFLTAPKTAISPQHQAVKDKMKYYGIKNITTGEGITKDTDVSTPPGITTGDDTTV